MCSRSRELSRMEKAHDTSFPSARRRKSPWPKSVFPCFMCEAKEILKLMPENSVRSLSEYMSLMNSSNLPQLRPFTRTMVALGIVVSFLVVLLNMHTMVLERTREIGILKALGFSRLDVVQMLLGETLILASMGTGLGIALTFLMQAILKQTNPGLTILISPAWLFSAAALALLGAASGAVYPALRAASYDPVVALASASPLLSLQVAK